MIFTLLNILVLLSVSFSLKGIPPVQGVKSKLEASTLETKSTIPSTRPLNIGIVGATGAVGEEILAVMEKRNFPCRSLKLFASEKSSGKVIQSSVYGSLTIEPFSFEVAKTLDVVLLAVGGDFSLEWAEKLSEAGVLVIDNSSAFRYKDGIPLVIPEINIGSAKGKKLIANPNCTTAIALMALFPIHKRFKIKKIIMSTYQAASGAGAQGMQELKDGMKAIVEGEQAVNHVFAYPLPYNIIPHIDAFQPNSYVSFEYSSLFTHILFI
jgi:aspartate-semialdehyde dehydrogenase